MELDQSKVDQFVKREFRRNPNPQFQPRQIKNEDQKIQAPLKNENFIGEMTCKISGIWKKM